MNSDDSFAPYAPLASMLMVIRRFRDAGLPEVLSHQQLMRVGVSEGNARRTLQALRFLDLVDEEGRRTPAFERLRRATEAEYPEVLAEIVRAAYQSVFEIVDPAGATDPDINDAFRHFQPQGQRQRMVLLFTGLCREAGLMPGGQPETRKRLPTVKRTTPPKSGISSSRTSPVPVLQESLLPLEQVESASIAAPPVSRNAGVDSRYFLLEGLLRQLPDDGRWTTGRRDRWLGALTANLDLLVEVIRDEEKGEAASTVSPSS